MSAEPQPLEGETASENLPTMGILEHLEELRYRIVRSLIAVCVAFLATWWVHEEIFTFLERPIRPHLPDGGKLAVFGVQDAFILYIKVAALAAVFLAAPWILYQIWCFIAPGLYKKERHLAALFVAIGSLLFLGGGAFAYFVAFPFAVKFLLGVGEQFQAVIAVDRYLRFLMTIILGLGVMFELPLVVFALAQMGVVTPAFLMRHFRWAVLIIFIISAILTPTPDILNLCLFALPTLVLYLLGVGAAALVQRRKKKREAREAEDAS